MVGLALVAAAGFFGWMHYNSGAASVSHDDAVAAPSFDLPSLAGRRYRLSEFTGRVLVVEFWATWCGPCRLQAQILDSLYSEIKGPEVEFLAVSLGEPEEVVREFVERSPFSYPVLLDTEESLGSSLQIFALPTVAVIDRHGRIVYLRPGISDGDSLRSALVAAGLTFPGAAAS